MAATARISRHSSRIAHHRHSGYSSYIRRPSSSLSYLSHRILTFSTFLDITLGRSSYDFLSTSWHHIPPYLDIPLVFVPPTPPSSSPGICFPNTRSTSASQHTLDHGRGRDSGFCQGYGGPLRDGDPHLS